MSQLGVKTPAMKYVCGVLLLVAAFPGLTKGNNAFLDIVSAFGQGLAESIRQIVEGIINAIKASCKRNGGEGAFDKLSKAFNEMNQFYHFDFDVIEREIEKSKKAGKLKEFSKKCCDIRTPFLNHVQELLGAITTCADQEYRQALRLASNVSESLINFACDNDGKSITSFLEEDGIECVREEWNSLERCGVGDSSDILEQIQKLANTKEVCSDFEKIHECVIKAMEGCKKSTPSKIIDALFNVMYTSLFPCLNLAEVY